MLPLLALSLLAASPATGLTLSTQLGTPTTPTSTWLDAVEQELIAAGVPVRRLTLNCEGARDCLLGGARAAQLAAVVGVSVVSGKKDTTLDLEALRSDDGASVAQLTFTVTSRLGAPERARVRDFAARLVEALAVPPEPDVPVVEHAPTLVPQVPVQPGPAVVAAEPPPAPRRSRVPAWLLAGGALAAGVTSGVFLGTATATRAALENPPDPSTLTRTKAEQLKNDANTDYSVALATGLAAGALATGAIVWLLLD